MKISRMKSRLNISFSNNQTFHSSANMTSFSLFSSDQMTALKIMISESVNTAMKTAIESIQSIINEIISNMQSQNQLFSAQNVQTSWKLSEIEFFYSDMFISWEHRDIVNRKNKIYYKLIIIFINKFRITTSIKNAVKIHQNLNICLHKKIKKWWINELDELVHAELIAYHNDMKQWCKILKKHFQTSSS